MVDINTLNDLQQRADEAFNKGEYEIAMQLYTEAIELAPEDGSLYIMRSSAYNKLKHSYHWCVDSFEDVHLNQSFLKRYAHKSSAMSYKKGLHTQIDDFSNPYEPSAINSEMMKRKDEVREQLPWVYCCVGVIIGVVIVILDYFFVENDPPRNPLMQVGTILTIACASFGLGRHYVSPENTKLLD